MAGLKFLLVGCFLLPLAANAYNYDNTLKWNMESAQCAGTRQSPIELDHQHDVPSTLYPISFSNFDVPLNMPIQVVNNGHSVALNVGNSKNGFHPFITGGGLNENYEVETVHFHWGSPQVKGSEHAFNGKKYDLEMHIVCKNMKFKTVQEASHDPFGLAVLGVLFKQEDDADVPQAGINQILELLPLLKKSHSMAHLRKSLTIGSLLSHLDPKKFYTYRGSLTTPPCSQSVTWIVFEDVRAIKSSELQQFWTLLDDRGLPLVNNFRPLQLQNRRKVFSRSV